MDGDPSPNRQSRLAPISDPPQTRVGVVGPKDDRFNALITSLADRQRFPRAHRDAMITAAHQVCAMVASGRSVSDASTRLKVGYGFTEAQAQAVGAVGVAVYCPESRP